MERRPPDSSDLSAPHSMRPKREVDPVEGQMPLIGLVEGHETFGRLDDLPDISVGSARYRLLRRMKHAVDVVIALEPNGVEVNDQVIDVVKGRLGGRIPHIEMVNERRLLIQFNALSEEGSEAAMVTSFAEALAQLLGGSSHALEHLEYYNFANYLTPDERQRIDAR